MLLEHHFVKRYIRNAVREASDAKTEKLDEIFQVIFKEARECDHESNDSTIYAYMLSRLNKASDKELKYVSESLRKGVS